MLWDIRARMKPALSVIDLIPNVHRTPALAALRRAVIEGRPATLRLSPEDKELAFYDAQVPLISPIGGRMLKALHDGGHLKLKKPAASRLPALDAYIATEAAFRADVAAILAAEDARRARIYQITRDPGCARADEITPYLIDKVIAAHLGHAGFGQMQIGGLTCHREWIVPAPSDEDRALPEGRVVCWWLDADGKRQGDAI